MWEQALATEALQTAIAGATTYAQRTLRLFGMPESEIAESRLERVADLLTQRRLVGGHIEERHAALGERVGHSRHDGVTQLPFQIADVVDIASAADLGVE